ncbi:PH domain-containing protein [Streptomyces sp. JJ38]|uniref:PH domain-containing protein n=1 Tax=Streptomyces sp. JJ38 TaxID=2738128 RepID=UPI001C59CCB7|nr:PH domain-containing protein [Streptomyces sp. JJ38]MBW1596819.1 PH domain-containing protein [Streptomyces sp. JJ38]
MTSEQQPYADRSYRSPAALVGGTLLLGVVLWVGGDAMLRGEGRAPLTAAAFLLFLVPLVVAFTLRPAVFAGADAVRIRNPFRTITVPWGAVVSIRSVFSNELVVEDSRKFQLWAIPVSLRARRVAQRRNERRAAGKSGRGYVAGGLFGLGGGTVSDDDSSPSKATGDEAVATLRELAELNEGKKGEPTVRWAYEILVPAVVGALAAAVLVVTG